MRTLAIETSCDDTSIAVVTMSDGGFQLEKILAYTQTKEHQQRGGVVPELAARSHAEKILVILEELALNREMIDTISVTAYPGLPGALVVGVTTAYTLGVMYDKPVIEVNHIMGHVFSVLIDRSSYDLVTPVVCLTVSGGHNDLYLLTEKDSDISSEYLTSNWTKHHHLAVGEGVQVGHYQITKLGQTIDDAAGEAFDKAARMLGGPYPGGKWIGEQAERYTPLPTEKATTLFHGARLAEQVFNFSFSGIKSQCYQHLASGAFESNNPLHQAHLARAFQEEVTQILTEKLLYAADFYNAKMMTLVGGVSANKRLREKIATQSDLHCLRPTEFVYCTDNAAMIGVVGLLTRESEMKR